MRWEVPPSGCSRRADRDNRALPQEAFAKSAAAHATRLAAYAAAATRRRRSIETINKIFSA